MRYSHAAKDDIITAIDAAIDAAVDAAADAAEDALTDKDPLQPSVVQHVISFFTPRRLSLISMQVSLHERVTVLIPRKLCFCFCNDIEEDSMKFDFIHEKVLPSQSSS